MKPIKYLPMAFLLMGLNTEAQITITLDDMFIEPGEYYRAYSNEPPNILGEPNSVVVAGLMGNAGGGNYWDFSQGPTDDVYRYDYLPRENNIVWFDYPEATVAERAYRESEPGDYSWLLYDPVPGLGRKLFGFWKLDSQYVNPSNRFTNPVVDFPDEINFGDSWTNDIEYRNSYPTDFGGFGGGGGDLGGLDDVLGDLGDALGGLDDILGGGGDSTGGGGEGLPMIIRHVQSFEVDAYGFIELPDDLGIFECLRVNSLLEVTALVDIEGSGSFSPLGTQNTRVYYWLVPGKGIAAQMTSTASAGPIPDQFNEASLFQRMFETNKQPRDAGCAEAEPVTGLDIVYQSNLVRLKWEEAACAQNYRVQYSLGGLGSGDWQDLTNGSYTDTFFIDTQIKENRVKLYRVISERN